MSLFKDCINKKNINKITSLPGEAPRAANASLQRVLQPASRDRVPRKAAHHHYFLSQGHAEYSYFNGATSEDFPVSSGVKRAVSWLPCCLEFSSLCSFSVLSVTVLRVYFTRELMVNLQHCSASYQEENQTYRHPRTSDR